MNRFIKNAQKILIGNRKRGYTLPTNNKLYPAQWNWDSAFIALGYSYFNLNFALKEIKTLLDGQWKDGMVPHILFHNTGSVVVTLPVLFIFVYFEKYLVSGLTAGSVKG